MKSKNILLTPLLSQQTTDLSKAWVQVWNNKEAWVTAWANWEDLTENKNLEGPGKGEWVPRTFIMDTADTTTEPDHKWPLTVAHFPDGWSALAIDSLPPAGQSSVRALDASDDGLTVALAYKTTNPDGSFIPKAQQHKHAIEFIKADLAVDANRDGIIKFGGTLKSTDPAIKAALQDATTQATPFRFWCNDDHDTQDDLEDGEPLSGPADSADNEIKSERDLEDFCRLHLNIGGLQEAIAAGTIQVGLEWRNTSGGSPSIKVYRAAEPDGGNQYLRNDNGSGGIGNEYAAILQTATPFKTALGTIDSTPGFKFPLDFWQSTPSGIIAFDADHPNRYLIFEGVTAGKGQLVMTFWKGTTRIGEGGGCWLDIKQIKKMYQRWDSASGQGSHPWAGDEFEAPPNESKDDAIIFVHGWRMNPEGAGNFAETMFKRLWQRGFKGRFVAFHWDTWWYDAWQWLPQHDVIGAALAHYNDSEFTAWQTGNTLKGYVDNLPFQNKNIIAHSMGNIVVSEALRKGMSIQNYAMLNAAVPASCYDDNEGRIKQPSQSGPAGITLWNVETPDGDTDSVAQSVTYRGTHKTIGGNLINFYLEADTATTSGWEVNNRITKPEPYIWGDTMHTYEFDPEEDAGHHLYKRNANDNNVQYYFDVSRKYEGMAYACMSWGKVVGAWSNTAGVIDDKVNLADPALNGNPRGFDKEHSAEFNRRIQKLTPFYNKLMDKLGVKRSNP